MNVYMALGAWVLVVHKLVSQPRPTEVAEIVLGP